MTEPWAEGGGFGHQDGTRTVRPSRAPPVPSEPAHVGRDETEASSGIFPIQSPWTRQGTVEPEPDDPPRPGGCPETPGSPRQAAHASLRPPSPRRRGPFPLTAAVTTPPRRPPRPRRAQGGGPSARDLLGHLREPGRSRGRARGPAGAECEPATHPTCAPCARGGHLCPSLRSTPCVAEPFLVPFQASDRDLSLLCIKTFNPAPAPA